MGVDTYALISVDEYKRYDENYEISMLKDAFDIYCKAADATAATVKKTGNVLTLVITGGASAGTVAITLTAVAYDTLKELVDYINTLAWYALRKGLSLAPSTDIKEFVQTNALGVAQKQTLRYFNNYALEFLIDSASDMIEDYLRRKVKVRAYTMERYSGDGTNELLLENYPVKTVSQVSIGAVGVVRVKHGDNTKYNVFVRVTDTGVELYVEGSKVATKAFADFATLKTLAAAIGTESGWTAEVATSLYEAWPSTLLFPQTNKYCRDSWTNLEVPEQPVTDFEVDYDEGVIYFPSSIPEGFNNVFVTYEGGFDTVPDDLIEYCCEFVKYVIEKKEADPLMASESLGDYSYSRRDLEAAIGVEGMKGLRRYRRPVL